MEKKTKHSHGGHHNAGKVKHELHDLKHVENHVKHGNDSHHADHDHSEHDMHDHSDHMNHEGHVKKHHQSKSTSEKHEGKHERGNMDHSK